MVREQLALTVSRLERRDSALSDALKRLPIYTVGDWVWACDIAAAIRQGAKSSTDAKRFSRRSYRSTGRVDRNWTKSGGKVS